jgi:hypothetical protein
VVSHSRLVTHMGLWLNQGGWPPGEDALYHAALEPCTGGADDLAVAIRLGEAMTLGPHASLHWEVALRVGAGPRALAALMGETGEEAL